MTRTPSTTSRPSMGGVTSSSTCQSKTQMSPLNQCEHPELGTAAKVPSSNMGSCKSNTCVNCLWKCSVLHSVRGQHVLEC
eukprot:3238884-Rhodomonas_salina.1